MVVEQRHWVSETEFTELLGLCQFLPGGNIINLAIAIGARFAGAAGSRMTPHATLAVMAAVFAQLSLLAFGGVNAVLPEMHRQVVQVHHWITADEFASLYALAQAAPGPNMLVATLIGWRVAGLGGALVTTLSLCAPASLLTFGAVHLWYRFRDAAWRVVVQRGPMPVTAGLMMASAVVLAESTTTGWKTAALTGVATVVFLRTRLKPLIVLAAGAGLGVLGVLG